MAACLSAELPGTELYSSLSNSQFYSDQGTLAEAFLQAGASVYISSTIPQSPVPDFLYANVYASMVKSPSTLTVGQAFLASKNALETIPEAAGSDGFDQAAGMQLYGDPTLTYGMVGSR